MRERYENYRLKEAQERPLTGFSMTGFGNQWGVVGGVDASKTWTRPNEGNVDEQGHAPGAQMFPRRRVHPQIESQCGAIRAARPRSSFCTCAANMFTR